VTGALELGLLGGAVFGAVGVLVGLGDPTDGWFLYLVAVPAGMVAAAALGWRRAPGWAAGLAWGLGLWLGGIAAVGEAGNLWPMAMVFHLVLSLPAVLAGLAASALGRRRAP